MLIFPKMNEFPLHGQTTGAQFSSVLVLFPPHAVSCKVSPPGSTKHSLIEVATPPPQVESQTKSDHVVHSKGLIANPGKRILSSQCEFVKL